MRLINCWIRLRNNCSSACKKLLFGVGVGDSVGATDVTISVGAALGRGTAVGSEPVEGVGVPPPLPEGVTLNEMVIGAVGVVFNGILVGELEGHGVVDGTGVGVGVGVLFISAPSNWLMSCSNCWSKPLYPLFPLLCLSLPLSRSCATCRVAVTDWLVVHGAGIGP